MTQFYISMDVANRTWREIELEGKETYDDATASVVENSYSGAITISLDQYYSKYGEFSMTITQPLDRAIRTFMAALEYDTARENEHVS